MSKHTGHAFRWPAEIAADRGGFPPANETRDLYSSLVLKMFNKP